MSKKKLKLKRPIKIFLNFLLLLSLVTGTYLFINRKETSIKSPNKSTSTKRPRIVNASFIGDLLYEQHTMIGLEQVTMIKAIMT